jgi:hypothetical protein
MKWVSITCRQHGEQPTATVCLHLAQALVTGDAVGGRGRSH